MKTSDEIFIDHQLQDQKREQKIADQFTEQTGEIPARIDQAFPFDRHVHIHTEDRTWEAMLTLCGVQLMKDSIKELVL